ncbi:4-oxalocrotonate tautomerase family protein [Streptomyces sp. NPDC049813]|uniref:4-oxalocrotonate tautomerase family protein n=1 Tax=Streptomyces sp. NPDC049813 TaxID=3365597 RepID=UPI0037BB0B7B
MPVITVDWWQGNDRAARAALVAELTESAARIAGCPHSSVTVLVRDVPHDHWSIGGRLADELVAAPRAGSRDEP